jgi:hypothetical protein
MAVVLWSFGAEAEHSHVRIVPELETRKIAVTWRTQVGHNLGTNCQV